MTVATDTTAARRPPDVRPGAEVRRQGRSPFVGLGVLARLGCRSLPGPAAGRGRRLGLGDDFGLHDAVATLVVLLVALVALAALDEAPAAVGLVDGSERYSQRGRWPSMTSVEQKAA
jgi:hypothetical protein